MNDRAVTALGRIYRQDLNAKEDWELYAENMFPGDQHMIISPVFRLHRQNDSSTITFSHVDIRPYSDISYKKYAYRKGASNGGDITVTTKFGSFEDEKTYRNKKVDTILNFVIPRLITLAGDDLQYERELFKMIKACWVENLQRIGQALFEVYSPLDAKVKFKCGLSLILEDEGREILPDELLLFRKALVNHATEGLSTFTGVISEGKDSACSICMRTAPRLHGFASPFKYYTVDKKGYLANYFNMKLAWKNYPVCSECAANFYLGSRVIENELSYYFYGRPYMAVPRVLVSDPEQERVVYELFKEYNNVDRSNQEAYEDDLMLYMAEQNNFFNVDMIFYQKNMTTGAIRLKSHIEEVFPSRFKKIFVEAKDHVETHPVFARHLVFEENESIKGKKTGKKIQFRQKFRLGKLLAFFDKEDYSVIQAVFDGTEISEESLHSAFMNKFRENYSQELQEKPHQSRRKLVIDAISVIYFLHYLGSLKINTKNHEVKMPQDIEKPGKGSIDLDAIKAFIDDNQVFFNKEYKIGIFLLGVLVKIVMNAQQVRLKNTPFEKKLKGYKISGGDVENIYVEALSKLQQYYDAYAYGNLRKLMTEYFNLRIPEIKVAPSAEVSFYFVTGMETQFKFKSQLEPGEDNE
ncbi:MAG: hypothetical protein AMXMBFR49_20440 [Chlorobiota bacterium]